MDAAIPKSTAVLALATNPVKIGSIILKSAILLSEISLKQPFLIEYEHPHFTHPAKSIKQKRDR
jgi:hypothetical protein